MHFLSEIINYIILFVALYFEIFFLITYFEMQAQNALKNKFKLVDQNKRLEAKLPSVSVIVPVWNEETTVLKTIFSLLKIDYPKDKLSIIIVDDGSTDKTWNIVQRFKRNKQVTLLSKENGGKHTALNYGLQFVKTELVGSLDADSFVHPQALKRIVQHFENPEIMAVTPSVKIFEPHGFLGLLQKAEYIFGVFLRKVFSYLNSIYITPGPLSIFRKEVFEILGGYRRAHNTEDMEMAMRMQKHNMKISNAHDAFIYTVAPTTLRTLYKQRLRWTYGFIKNALDYRGMFFRPQYGNLGFAVLPAAGFSIISSVYLFGYLILSSINSLITKISQVLTIGIDFPKFNFDLFYVNTSLMTFISLVAVTGTVFIIITSRKLAEEKTKIGFDSLIFLGFYTMIAPIWISLALYNVVFGKKTSWR